MKSLRTIRHGVKPTEPARASVHASRAAGASAGTVSLTGNGRRESRSSLPGPSAGWRLPSGQLLVEYALQTCFTGSPFDRSPFQTEKEGEAEIQSGVPTASETLITQGLHSLQAAVSREASTITSPAPRRTSAARSNASSNKALAGKERPRS